MTDSEKISLLNLAVNVILQSLADGSNLTLDDILSTYDALLKKVEE